MLSNKPQVNTLHWSCQIINTEKKIEVFDV